MQKTKAEIEAFRTGVKWGMRLFARQNEDGVRVVGQKGHLLSICEEEVDEGKWDTALKYLPE